MEVCEPGEDRLRAAVQATFAGFNGSVAGGRYGPVETVEEPGGPPIRERVESYETALRFRMLT